MMLARVLPLRVAKEAHALLPLWLGCLAALVCLGALVGGGGAHALGMFIYGGASVTLGALSIGHEYTHGTLAQLLSQPASRARLFLVKQAVLTVMLLILAAAAWGTVVYPTRVTATIVVLGVLCGLFIAPWLTMMCRNPLAGAVFPIPIAGWTWLLVDMFAMEPLKITVFSRAMMGFCAVAAVLGWRKFMRLEARDGRGPHVHMQWSSPAAVAAPARRRHPVWWLVRKELGLQQMALVVFVIYLLSSVGVGGHLPDRVGDTHGILTPLYSGLLALLIGSLASAEERQFGTLESQLLLPVASSTQWVVKVGVALGLSLLFAVGLPALIIAWRGGAIRINEWYACAILTLTVTSVYMSSLCNTGIRALLLSVLATPFVMVVGAHSIVGRPHLTVPQAVLIGGLLILALWFGLENHRSAEHGVWRIARQAFVMAGCLAFAGVVLAAL